MRKPVFAICEQQRRRSACASAQSDQHLCYSLPRLYNTSSFYIRNFKPLPSFCICAGRFESALVANLKTVFSRNEAELYFTALLLCCHQTKFLTIKWKFTSPNDIFECSYSLICYRLEKFFCIFFRDFMQVYDI